MVGVGVTHPETAEFEMVGFTPTESQWPILECRKRFILVTGGEQSGKSMVASKYLLMRFAEPGRGGLYWLVGADYLQTEREFEYLRDDFGTMGLLKEGDCTKRVDPGRLVLKDGTRIETKSAKDPMKLTRESPDGIIVCEAGQLDLQSYERLNGRVAKSRGWLFMVGTLEGSVGWYPSLALAWDYGDAEHQRFKLASWSNTYAYPEGRQDPEILRLERETSDEYFLERIGGEVVPPKGLVFSEFRADIHVRESEWVEGEPVYLWEDPGFGGESAHALEVVQIIDGQVRVFDEIYERGLITNEIIDIAMGRRWWRSPKTLVSDPHYKDQHHSTSSVADIWLARTSLVAGGERMRINAGIERLKSFLKPDPLTGVPRIVFSPRCKGILSEMGMAPHPLQGPHYGQIRAYSWKLDKDGAVVGETPEDKYNHGCKAITYGLVWQFGYAREYSKSVVKLVKHR